MKQLLLLLAVGAAAAVPASAVEIYGYQAWEYMENPTRGPIHFSSDDPSQSVLIADQTEQGVIYGGYYLDYHWYGQVITKGTQSSVDGLYEIDMNTGERTLIAKGGTKLIDMTYDYSTGTVYGIRTGNTQLGTLNPKTGQVSMIGSFKNGGADVYMLAIAADLEGKLYGISPDDNLYLIDKATAAVTLVGSTGADAGFDQTMTFDHNTGVLYWTNNGTYRLYTVDVNTGAATPVGAIGANGLSSMANLTIPYIYVANGAPDRVTGASVSTGGNSVTLAWTNPSITAQGRALTELTSVVVVRDGVEIATVDASVGSAGTYTDLNLETEKDYSYSLVPVNTAGRGGVDSRTLDIRVGNDTPGAVTQLAAAHGDGSAVLTWKAPAVGAHGGTFDPASLTAIKVRRGNTLVATLAGNATTYTDKTSFGFYSYSVTAVNEQGEGVPATVENVMVKPGNWVVMTDGRVELETGKEYEFYDDGGPNASYRNSYNYTMTVAPAEQGAYVVAEFSKFELDTYGDYLEVYDGADVNAPKIGQFASMSVPAELAHLEASSESGALTFVFLSDIMFPESGWKATLQSVKRLNHDLEASEFKPAAFVEAGARTTCNLKVTNKGIAEASGWSVVLLDGETELATVSGAALAPAASTTVSLEYTPAAPATLNLSAKIVYAADENMNNNVTTVIPQTVMPAGSTIIDITTNDPRGISILPLSFLSIESLTQVILTPDRLAGVAGMKLAAVEFPYYEVTKTYENVPLTMWVGNTDKTDLVAGSIPASAQTKVFDGKINVYTDDEALSLVLDGAPEYDGKTMVMTFHKHESPSDNYGVSFRGDYGYVNAHDNVCRFTSRSYSDDPALDPESNFGYSANNHLPDMKLVFTGAAGITEIEVCPSGISLIAGGIASATDAVVYSVDGRVVATIEACSQTLLPAGVYIVRTATATLKVAVR